MWCTYDVHFYASFSLLELFPKIELNIQREFARAVLFEDERKVKILAEGKNGIREVKGAVPHDLETYDPWHEMDAHNIHDTSKWRDLNLKFLLQVYRDFAATGDLSFGAEVWPVVCSAMAYMDQFNRDDDCLIENDGFPDQTYDMWTVHGVSVYCGCLWLATLQATESMVSHLGDTTTAKGSLESSLWVVTDKNTEGFTPSVYGLDNFKGSVTHSSEYVNGQKFGDKNVRVVGSGNSDMLHTTCAIGVPKHPLSSGINVGTASRIQMGDTQVMTTSKDIEGDVINFHNGQERQLDELMPLCLLHKHNAEMGQGIINPLAVWYQVEDEFKACSILNEEMRRKSQGSSSHSDVLVTERQGRSKSRGPSNRGNHRSSSSKGKFVDVEYYDMVNLAHDDSSWILDSGATLTQGGIGFAYVKHVPDMRLNIISTGLLDEDGYHNSSGNGLWKVTLILNEDQTLKDVEKTEKETIPQHNDDPIDLDPVPPKHFDAQFGDDIQNDEEQNDEEHGGLIC
ncbi:non-lysosomal glucosylceramidase-like protein isoform X2 [Tanacetum coccineum]